MFLLWIFDLQDVRRLGIGLLVKQTIYDLLPLQTAKAEHAFELKESFCDQCINYSWCLLPVTAVPPGNEPFSVIDTVSTEGDLGRCLRTAGELWRLCPVKSVSRFKSARRLFSHLELVADWLGVWHRQKQRFVLFLSHNDSQSPQQFPLCHFFAATQSNSALFSLPELYQHVWAAVWRKMFPSLNHRHHTGHGYVPSRPRCNSHYVPPLPFIWMLLLRNSDFQNIRRAV